MGQQEIHEYEAFGGDGVGAAGRVSSSLLYLPCKNGLNTTFKPFLSIIFLVNKFIYTRYCLTNTLVEPKFASVASRVSFSALYVKGVDVPFIVSVNVEPSNS